jgi:hypothetical protein
MHELFEVEMLTSACTGDEIIRPSIEFVVIITLTVTVDQSGAKLDRSFWDLFRKSLCLPTNNYAAMPHVTNNNNNKSLSGKQQIRDLFT